MRAAIVVVTVRIVLLSMLVVVFPSIIDHVCNDGGNIIAIGDEGGIICRSADVMITIYFIMFTNVRVRMELIPIKDFFGDGGEGILI